MKSFLKLGLLAFLIVIVTSQNYPLTANISGYYNLTHNYSISDCTPNGLYVFYDNYTLNTTNSSSITFTFAFPWIQSCYTYYILGDYTIYPIFYWQNPTTFTWYAQNITDFNCSGRIIITDYNITINASIYFGSKLLSRSLFMMNRYIPPPTPQLPNLPPYLAIHSYLYPNYASNTSCYPSSLQVLNVTTNITNFTDNNNTSLIFKWNWQNTTACRRYGLYNQSQSIPNFTFLYSGNWNWTQFTQHSNISVQGTWSEDNELMDVYFFEPFYNSFTMVKSIQPFISLNGTWAINTYLNPDYLSAQICYPSTFQFQPLDNTQNSSYYYGENGILYYNYYLYVSIPCVSGCPTSCGSTWFTEIILNGTYGSNYWNFNTELSYLNYISGWWNSVNNTMTIYQSVSNLMFSYMLVEID